MSKKRIGLICWLVGLWYRIAYPATLGQTWRDYACDWRHTADGVRCARCNARQEGT